ncbi:MAG: hypothetical protein SFV17_08205 [Candidatus Obscuribacter sp.]|nr:hypothetical protein [Candidatus Melainabacteria bacterium]MDX1986654.1 hypothetical protein [Candidatus Obscuribacter sp.]
MNTFLLSRLLGLSRFRVREEAKHLAFDGKMPRARKLIFQSMVERADRHGEDSDESLETLLWLAEIHFQKAVAALNTGRTLLQLAPDCHYRWLTIAISVLKRADADLSSARSALQYAERQIDEKPRVSLFYARLELALFLLKESMVEEVSLDHLHKCIEVVQKLLKDSCDYRLLETVDELVELIYVHFSEASEYAAIARQLAVRAEEERALQEKHAAEMEILFRPG